MADRAVVISLNRYNAGIDSYTNVAVAVNQALSNRERSSIQIANERLTASIQLIKAIGGAGIHLALDVASVKTSATSVPAERQQQQNARTATARSATRRVKGRPKRGGIGSEQSPSATKTLANHCAVGKLFRKSSIGSRPQRISGWLNHPQITNGGYNAA